MGLFSKLRELLDEGDGDAVVVAPVAGRLVPLADVPDPMFVEGVLGDGFGIWPDDDCVHAPVAGRVTAVIESRHAVGLGFERFKGFCSASVGNTTIGKS